VIEHVLRRRAWLVINLGILMCIAAAPAGALARTTVQTTIPGGNHGNLIKVNVPNGGGGALDRGHNKGDVWVDNAGQPPGPGHEMDPHLACQDINLWGVNMEDPGGTFTIDGWPPSGSGHADQDYAASWTYNQGTGGDQVMQVIQVHTLIANAIAHGDKPHPIQGFHFKLQLVQDPQKHKTFWVRCPETTPAPTPTPPPHQPKLSLNKVADKAVANVGDTITYTVTVRNTGGAAATHVVVDDVISGTAGFVVNDGTHGTTNSFAAIDNAPQGGVQKVGTNHYHWTYASLAAGDDGIVTYTAKVTSAGTTATAVNGDNQVTNTASIPECCSKTVVTLVPLPGSTPTPSPTATPRPGGAVSPITGPTPIPSTGTALNLGLATTMFTSGLLLVILGLAIRPRRRRLTTD